VTGRLGRDARRQAFLLLAGLGALLITLPGSSFGGTSVPADQERGGAGPSSRLPSAMNAASFTQQVKLVARDGIGRSAFGEDVALSADGRVALVGAPGDGSLRGAAWVIRQRGQSWTSTKLTGREKGSELGRSVALSANGRVALVGAPGERGGKGAAWVFSAQPGGSWVGTKLTPTSEKGKGRFGASVALSADGRLALVGAPVDDKGIFASGGKGAAWVFRRSGSTWIEWGGKLTGRGEKGNGRFGSDVALSANGSTVLVGGPGDDGGKGAAWVLSRRGQRWTSRKLTGGAASDRAEFGRSVALSGLGGIALIGGRGDDGKKGAAWFFAYLVPAPFEVGSWFQEGKVTATGETGKGEFGHSVALSRDGTTGVIGGRRDGSSRGAAWVFTASEVSRGRYAWAQQGRKLTGERELGKGEFGFSVALSADGNTALVGGWNDNVAKGAAWVFFNLPQVRAVTPALGPTAGGTRVTITGSGFTEARGVTFGSTPASSFTVDSPTQITAISPPGGAGTVGVSVRNSRGNGGGTGFTYARRPVVTAVSPSSGPTTSGTQVTISGTDLNGAIAVAFGATSARFKVDTATRITAFAPPAPAGTVDVIVTTPGGTSSPSAADRFTYVAPVTQKIINFDDLTTGGPGGALVTIDSQYAGQGITFNSVKAIDYSKGPSALPGFARSGTVALEQCVGVEFCTTPIRATFDAPQRAVLVYVGFSFPLNQAVQVELKALNASSSVVGTASATLPANPSPTPIRIPLEVRLGTASITLLEVSIPGGYNSALAVDDATFEGP